MQATKPVISSLIAPTRKAVHGKGRAELHVFGDTASFKELSYTYPLKLLSPRSITAAQDEAGARVAILYSLSYGGGLIGGDRIELTLDVKPAAKMLLLTQGSTKVFPSRTEQRLSSGLATAEGSHHTIQRMIAHVAENGLLVLLPDPVTPYKAASYSQTQIFRLKEATKSSAGGSLVLLDWFTSGRFARGEEWQFDRYRSTNEIWIGERQVACDVLLLEHVDNMSKTGQNSSGESANEERRNNRLQKSLAPYACYATVIMFGELTRALSASLERRYDGLSQMQRRTPESLLWSFSPLENGAGCIVRVAATETDAVRRWLKEALCSLESSVGKDAYSKAFL